VTTLLCVLAAAAYVISGVCMRKAAGFSCALPSLMVFVCLCAGAVLQTLSLRRGELGVNYVVVLGLEAGLALLLGVTWLGESLSARKLVGIALILAGTLSLHRAGEPRTGATALEGATDGGRTTDAPPVEPGTHVALVSGGLR
jgi:multidrug transporter EmrE-like cation transporter